jgi:hypothetical protein
MGEPLHRNEEAHSGVNGDLGEERTYLMRAVMAGRQSRSGRYFAPKQGSSYQDRVLVSAINGHIKQGRLRDSGLRLLVSQAQGQRAAKMRRQLCCGVDPRSA